MITWIAIGMVLFIILMFVCALCVAAGRPAPKPTNTFGITDECLAEKKKEYGSWVDSGFLFGFDTLDIANNRFLRENFTKDRVLSHNIIAARSSDKDIRQLAAVVRHENRVRKAKNLGGRKS